MKRTISILLFLLSGVVAAVHAQLPMFHFVGAPVSPHQSDATILLNDRLMCGHHLYDNATASWRELPQLREFYRTARGVEFPNTLLFTSPYVLNDSLIAFDSVFSVSQPQTFHIWNLNTDELVHTGTLPRLESRDYQRYYFLDANNDVVFYVLDTAAKSLTLTSYELGSTTGTTRSFPFTADVEIISILARSEGGYWIVGKNTVLFTQDFTTIQDVSPVGRQPGRTDISRDGSTLYVITVDTLTDQRFFSSLSTPDGTWSHVPISVDMLTSFSSSHVDDDGALWAYEHQAEASLHGRDDGFISFDQSGVERSARLPYRSRVLSFAHSRSGWIVANTITGLMQSADGGATWTALSTPSPERHVSGRIAIGRNGRIVITTVEGPAFLLALDQTGFTTIPGEYHQQEQDDHFPIRSSFVTPDIFDEDSGRIVVKFNDRWYLGDERGLAAMDRWSVGRSEGVWWQDTLHMLGNWRRSGSVPYLNTRKWVPGDVRDTSDPQGNYLMTSPITLSNGAVFYGGRGGSYAYSQSGQGNDLRSRSLQSYCMTDGGQAVWAYEHEDSIFILARDYGLCAELITAPINDLGALRRLRSVRFQSSYQWLNKGPGGQLFHLLHSGEPEGRDSVSIYSRDMQFDEILPLVGIEESELIDLVFHEQEGVYYATTTRGLYRSEPVVTSVAADVQRPSADVQRPAADVPLQTTWHNTLGQQIEPPTEAGLYFRVYVYVTGTVESEKVLIQ